MRCSGAVPEFHAMTAEPDPTPDLSRYHRQMLLPGVGEAGQRRLAAAHALIVGVGALGCAAADMLARAGIGLLTLIDRDVVEPTNLQRQCLFDERDAAEGLPKAVAAARRIAAINSAVAVTPIVEDLTPRTARRRFDAAASVGPAFDVILDGCDNFETRYLLNDLSVMHGIPYCYGGVVGTRGMAMTVRPGVSACLRCVFDKPPAPGTTPTCDTAGVLGPAVQIVAAWQAADALKLLLGDAASESHVTRVGGELREFDLWSERSRSVTLERIGGACVCCGQRTFEHAEPRSRGGRANADDDGAVLCGQDAVQIAARPDQNERDTGKPAIDLTALAERLRPHGPVSLSAYFLRANLLGERSKTRGTVELTVFPDGRSIVRGVPTPAAARTVYAKYVGS